MIHEKIENLIKASVAIGEVGVLIIDSNDANVFKAKKILSDLQYSEANDYLSVMNSLEKSKPVFYFEKTEKLNNLIWEIIRKFQGGIISLMDRANHTGLKTIKFDPKTSPFILIIDRKQIEKSPADFFEFVGPMESI